MTLMPLHSKPFGLVPVFFAEHEAFWKEGNSWSTLVNIIRRMQEWSFLDDILVVTDEPSLADTLGRHAIPARLVCAHDISCQHLPKGTFAALEALSGRPEGQSVIIRDIRQPLISEEEVRLLHKNWQESPETPLAGVSIPRDHPCQFFNAFTTSGGGFLHYEETSMRNAHPDFWVSRSCRLPAGHIPQAASDNPFWKAATVNTPSPAPSSLQEARSEGASLFEFQKDGTARLYVPRKTIPASLGEVVGISFATQSIEPAFLTKGSNGYTLQFDAPIHDAGDNVILCVNTGSGWSETILPLNAKTPFPYGLHEEGCFYFSVSTVQEGVSDFQLPYIDAFDRWKIVDGVLIKTDTGEPIFGRQNFPKTFQLDSPLVIGSLQSLRAYDQYMSNGQVKGIQTSWPAEKIENVVDHIYYSLANEKQSLGHSTTGDRGELTAAC